MPSTPDSRAHESSRLPSEFRRDLISGEWITIAMGRTRRPTDFSSPQERKPSPIETCPFEDVVVSGHEPPLLVLKNGQGRLVQVVKNKYPIVKHEHCPGEMKRGPFSVLEGTGFHEVVILGDHQRQIADLTLDEIALLLGAYQERYRALSREPCIRYILILHNFGEEAGASLWHPHSQIVAIPVLPPDVERSLRGSQDYFRSHRECVHCLILGWEEKEGSRIISENDSVLAITPFISRNAFEIRIFPKRHEPRFENAEEHTLRDFAAVLLNVLRRLKLGLNDPAYNFFLHTAPPLRLGEEDHSYYHWHLEILPRTDVSAGFELGTGIEVAVVDPDEAAAFLRSIKL